jgi:hypothetical protein
MKEKKEQYAIDHKPVSLSVLNHARLNQFRKAPDRSLNDTFTRICDLAKVPMPDMTKI